MKKEEANQKILEIMNKDDSLSEKEIQLLKEIIYNCDLTIQDKDGYTPIMYIFKKNKRYKLNVNTVSINYLIEHSNLSQQNQYGWTSFMFALFYNQEQNLQITKNQFQVMYQALTQEQQQKIMKKLIILIKRYIHKNTKNEHIEKIKFLLYDLKFHSNEETIDWLQENQYQDILHMIEKRDLFFQLNTDIKPMDNHQKIATIKV
jgi:ankyrin repeat protein